MGETSAGIYNPHKNPLRFFCTRLRGPKILTHTLTANGAEQDFPARDSFQQAEDAAAPGRGAEAKSASQCTLATPILVIRQGGGGEAQMPWRMSCEKA